MYKEDLSVFKEKKNDVRYHVKRITMRCMVLDNIKDLFPKEAVITPAFYGSGYIEVKLPDDTKVDKFEKVVRKVSKALNKEPSISVNKNNIGCYWSIYYHDGVSVTIELIVKNTESCEIIETTTTEEVTHYELTGYCKELQSAKYL